MSIVTKTGDSGETSLMYGRRVSKCDARVQACGDVDELSCAIGMARAAAGTSEVSAHLESIQRDLVYLMGELATAPEDFSRYAKDGFTLFDNSKVERLEQMISALERDGIVFQGWAMPGANGLSATLDFARAVCRRAERSVCAVANSQPHRNDNHLIFLNRLSDLLWLLARANERH